VVSGTLLIQTGSLGCGLPTFTACKLVQAWLLCRPPYSLKLYLSRIVTAEDYCTCQLRFFQEFSGPVASNPLPRPLLTQSRSLVTLLFLCQPCTNCLHLYIHCHINCWHSNPLPCRHLGPEVVLRVLPLDLQQGLSGSGEARTWLLPALRRHVSGTQLRYWAAHLMPLAKEMGQAAGAASQRGHKVCVAVVRDGEGLVCMAVCVVVVCVERDWATRQGLGYLTAASGCPGRQQMGDSYPVSVLQGAIGLACVSCKGHGRRSSASRK